MVSFLLFDRELSLGEKARLLRTSKGWRQIDVAAFVHCSPSDVSQLERDCAVPPGVKIRVLAALGIEDSEDEASSQG